MGQAQTCISLARTQLCGHTYMQGRPRNVVVCPEGKEMSFGKYMHYFAIASKRKTWDLNLGSLASETCSFFSNSFLVYKAM